MGRKMVVSIGAVAALAVFFCVGWWLGRSTERGEDGLLEAVLLGEAQFLYCSEGKAEAMDISGIPALFDGADPLMKIFDFAVVDLDGDGKEEVVLFVTGAAGDMGGKVILYQADSEVYGCSTDNSYSDPTGMAEAGIAAFSGFSREGVHRGQKSFRNWNL